MKPTMDGTEEFFAKTRPIANYPGYRIDEGGNVYSCITQGYRRIRHKFEEFWRMLKPIKSRGYHLVNLFNDEGPKVQLVHRLVLRAFVGECPSGCWGLHNDGNPDNNSLSNLRWGTPLSNQMDRFKHGTDGSGGRNGMAKLSEKDVLEIIRLRRCGVKIIDIARQFNVSGSNISTIVHGRSWGSITNAKP